MLHYASATKYNYQTWDLSNKPVESKYRGCTNYFFILAHL